MSFSINKDFIDCLKNRDLKGAMSLAPWGICPVGQRNFPNLIGVTLMAVEILYQEHPETITSPLLELLKQNLKLLGQHPYRTLIVKILAGIMQGLQYQRTSAKLNKLASGSLYFSSRTFDKITPFVHSLLESCNRPITTQKKMCAVIFCFNKERGSNDHQPLNLFLLHCFTKSSPESPLCLKARIAVLKIVVWEQSLIQTIALDAIRDRAERGLWRKDASQELGKAVFMADARLACGKNFAVFLMQNGGVLQVNVKRHLPDIENDIPLQIYVHVKIMDLRSREDWRRLSALSSNVKSYVDTVFESFAQLYEMIREDEYEVGAGYLKQALFHLLRIDLPYFVKAAAQRRSTLEQLVHELDSLDHLLPHDVIELTRIFSRGREIAAEQRDLYHRLLFPYLTRHSLPQNCRQEGLALLSGKKFKDVVLCRDFPQIFPSLKQEDLRDCKDSLVMARLLWPELHTPVPAWNGDLTYTIEQCEEGQDPFNIMALVEAASNPAHLALLQKAYPMLIKFVRDFVKAEDGDFDGTLKQRSKRGCVISAVAEGLLRLLIAINPNAPSEKAKNTFAEFIHDVYPRLKVRHDLFIALFIQLSQTTPWLAADLNFTFTFPEWERYDTVEIEEQNRLLDALGKAGLQPKF